MATLQDFIQQYIAEAASATDRNQAAKEVASKLRNLKYTGHDETIPKTELLNKLRVAKSSANDSHLAVIDTVISILEQSETK